MEVGGIKWGSKLRTYIRTYSRMKNVQKPGISVVSIVYIVDSVGLGLVISRAKPCVEHQAMINT